MAPSQSQAKPCVCKAKTQPSSTDAICCEKCSAWMHDVCIGIPAPEFARIDKYYCLLCISKTPSLRITYSRPSMPSKSSTDVLLEKLIEKLDALCDGLAKVSSRVDALEQQGSSAPAVNRYGQPPQQPLDVASIVCKVMAEQQVAERKKTRAVLERVPVQSPEEDAELVQSLAEKCGVAADLIADDIHRHGQEAPGRRRIMKVPFSSTEARDKFIRSFKDVKKSTEFQDPLQSVSVRRDLTELELQTHFSLKNRAYVLNKECGLYKYHYVDLGIIELRDPKPLRKRAPKVSED